METNDIKETWKAGIERTIKPYPEERLNEMVVNSARKSIKTVYPGTVFRLVIIAVAVFLIRHTKRHCYSARHVHLPSDHQTLSETELPENPARAERTVQTI